MPLSARTADKCGGSNSLLAQSRLSDSTTDRLCWLIKLRLAFLEFSHDWHGRADSAWLMRRLTHTFRAFVMYSLSPSASC